MVTVAELLEREASSVIFETVDADVLEHFGIPGMKWGHRKARIQKRIDRTQRIATGTASLKDRALGSALTKKGANRQLQRSANYQAKLAAGKGLAAKLTRKKAKQRFSELDFHKEGDAKAKRDAGQKAALAVLVGVGAVHFAKAFG